MNFQEQEFFFSNSTPAKNTNVWVNQSFCIHWTWAADTQSILEFLQLINVFLTSDNTVRSYIYLYPAVSLSSRFCVRMVSVFCFSSCFLLLPNEVSPYVASTRNKHYVFLVSNGGCLKSFRYSLFKSPVCDISYCTRKTIKIITTRYETTISFCCIFSTDIHQATLFHC